MLTRLVMGPGRSRSPTWLVLCRSAFPRGRGWHLRAEDRKAALEGRCLGLPIRRIGVRAPGDPLVRRRAATGFGYCEWAGGTTSCRLDPSHSPKPPEPAAGLGCEQFVLRDDAFACARVRLTRAVPRTPPPPVHVSGPCFAAPLNPHGPRCPIGRLSEDCWFPCYARHGRHSRVTVCDGQHHVGDPRGLPRPAGAGRRADAQVRRVAC
jgi:hypothetical protein